jgi:hypothetical protein
MPLTADESRFVPARSKSRQRAANASRLPAVIRVPARLLTPLAERPVESIAWAVVAALMTGIVLNAVVLQSARHPSPLFGTPITIAPLAAPAETPKPVPRPAATSAAPAPAQPALPVAVPTRAVAIPRDGEPAVAKAADPIGEMLRASPAHPSANAPVSPSAIDATRILLVQKALIKLGYVVRPDGVMGATTRQAIEKFERERGWPPHGELTPRVLREISLKSGLSFE